MNDDMTRAEYRDSLDKITTDADNNPTNVPQPKVAFATIGAGVGSAVSVVGIYILETALAIDIPEGVELSISVIITAGLAFLAGYLKRPSADAS